jgi:hypothetical protein
MGGLGLLVLGAGLLSVLAFVIGGAVVIVFVARQFRSGRGQLAVGLLLAFIIALIPTWDEVLGHIEFRRLCAEESGIRIHKQVVLDPEYRGTEFPDNFYIYDQLPIAKRYPHHLEENRNLPGPAVITRIHDVVRDGHTGEVLGTLTIFHYGGGWLDNATTTAGAGGGTCGAQDGGYVELLKRIFERRS